MNFANERHVDLDNVGAEQREARQARVSRAEIIQGNAKAALAERRNAIRQAVQTIEGGPLGDLENDAGREGTERSIWRDQLVVQQVGRAEVYEDDHGCRQPNESVGYVLAHAPAKILSPAQPSAASTKSTGLFRAGSSVRRRAS
jgi:hypothetical protein